MLNVSHLKRIKTKGKSLVTAIFFLIVILGGVGWLGSMIEAKTRKEAISITEESIRWAAVQCYALEGFYPTSLDYLIEHYGIMPDHKRYIVHYQYIGDNLLPDISVLPIER